jgi:hypothetical protein
LFKQAKAKKRMLLFRRWRIYSRAASFKHLH